MSSATDRAQRFVAERMPAAEAIGRRLAELITEPEAFIAALDAGLPTLADPVYRDAQAWVVPGATGVIGVRSPLLGAVRRPVERALRQASPAISIYLAGACAEHAAFEVRLLALVPLRRSLPADPERTWQLVRQMARRAHDWVSVDSLADLVARGLLLEPFRWAEIELLVYSPHHWERRLVGSTLAELPFRLPAAERPGLRDRPGLMLVESLMGDPDPDVAKALAWALRAWREVDPAGVAACLRRQAAIAARDGDGARAWVVRDALTGRSADLALAAELRPRLAGIRRRAGAPDTSLAHATAAAFFAHAMPDPLDVEEIPLDVERDSLGLPDPEPVIA